MTDCELCGKSNAEFVSIIEGSSLIVCSNCSAHGTTIKALKNEITKTSRPMKTAETIQIVIEDTNQNVRKARERLSLSQEDLAKKIQEKLSVIQHIESGKLSPDAKVAAKLERALGIKIIEEMTIARQGKSSKSSSGLTLGDIIMKTREFSGLKKKQ